MSEATPEEIGRRLADPMDPSEVKWKPQAVKGNRALAIAYIDARVIQDRLDEVVGVDGWQDEYQILPDNSVLCRLRVRIGEWVTKSDVGSPSEQPDGGDRLKAAFSDALKRTAVKFGIGRYLYRLPQQWCDYDPAKKQFVSTPKLPDFALPGGSGNVPRNAEPGKGKGNGKPQPKSGEEFHQMLRSIDSTWAKEGRIQIGALLAHVSQEGVKAGYGADMTKWDQDQVQFGMKTCNDFAKANPAKKPRTR